METIISADLQEATQALIEKLLASEPFLAYREARSRFNEDPGAPGLLERLSHAQAALRQKQGSGGATQTEIDGLRGLQAQVQRNSSIMAYAQAQQDAVKFLREVNGEISQLLGVDFAELANHHVC